MAFTKFSKLNVTFIKVFKFLCDFKLITKAISKIVLGLLYIVLHALYIECWCSFLLILWPKSLMLNSDVALKIQDLLQNLLKVKQQKRTKFSLKKMWQKKIWNCPYVVVFPAAYKFSFFPTQKDNIKMIFTNKRHYCKL